jgi:formate hydrogenlyase subunit 4
MPAAIHKRITEIFTEENLILHLDLIDGFSVRSIISTIEEQGWIVLLKLSCVYGFIFCFALLAARLKEIETSIVVSELTEIRKCK